MSAPRTALEVCSLDAEDIPDVESGRKDAECSFDAIMKMYKLTDPALKLLGPIVRVADTNSRDLTPESAGLYAIAGGFRLAYNDDHEQLDKELPVYDALYAWRKQQAAQ